MNRWNNEDMTPHAGVWAVVHGKNGTVLMQDHVKLQKWTIPVGKAGLKEDPEEVMKRELKEECGIEVQKMRLLKKGRITHFRDYGKVNMPVYLYEVTDYTGEPRNLEPHKHKEQAFLNPQKLVLEGKPISDAVKAWLKHKAKQDK